MAEDGLGVAYVHGDVHFTEHNDHWRPECYSGDHLMDTPTK